jgi:FdhE protein
MTAAAWDRRIARAEELSKTCPPAAEILRFYREVALFQKSIFEQIESRGGASRPDPSVLMPYFLPLLSLAKHAGPAHLARVAEDLAADQAQWGALLYKRGEALDAGKEFFARALLQPYMEYMACHSNIAVGVVQSVCPFCGEQSQVGVLRGEGDGGKRSLICSLCSTEWDFRRLLCPRCGEEEELKLPVYTAEQFPHVRVEACDTCHTFIKSVDLTKNGLAVPVVEELASVALNVWAEEHGYRKLKLNVLGM